MRKLSYMMKLLDGYTITNGGGDDEYHGHKNAPDTNIRMTMEQPEGAKGDVIDFFRITNRDGTGAPNPEFERLLPYIIRGGKTSWRLSGVSVSIGVIFIDFINDALRAQKESLYDRHKDEEAEAICSIIEVKVQVPNPDMDMTMRFEVPLPDGFGVSTTLVEIDRCDSLKVTELSTNGQRTITFLDAVEDEDNQYDPYSNLVEITEYSW